MSVGLSGNRNFELCEYKIKWKLHIARDEQSSDDIYYISEQSAVGQKLPVADSGVAVH